MTAHHLSRLLGDSCRSGRPLTHLISNDSEVSPRLSCSISLDRSIQCQQVGLASDTLDSAATLSELSDVRFEDALARRLGRMPEIDLIDYVAGNYLRSTDHGC